MNKNELNAKQIDKKEGVMTLQKKIVLIFFILGFSIALAGTVSAADDSTGTAVVSQETLATTSMEQTTNNSTNNSQALPDPKLYDENGNLVGSYATIQLAYNNAATGTSTQMYTIELEENGIFTLTDFTIAKNLIFTVANGGTATIQGSNDRLIYIQSGYTVYFYNITFENGHASDGTTFHPDGYNGGAIYNEGTLYLTNCTLRNNQAGDGGAWDYGGIGGNGGAIYNTGTATITDCEIYGNRAGDGSEGTVFLHSNGFSGGNGGAIYSTGTLIIINSELYNNLAGNGANGILFGAGGNGGNGGAIYSTGTTTITSTQIHDNLAGNAGAGGAIIGTGGTGGNGGAIYNTGTGTLTITDSEINSNTAGNGGHGYNALIFGGVGGVGGNGGAIYNTATTDITNTTIHDNYAGEGGAGGEGANGANGGAGGNGGAIYNTGTTTISNNTEIYFNTAGTGGAGAKGADGFGALIPGYTGGDGGSGGNGGAIYNTGTTNITNTTIHDNYAGEGGVGGNGGNGIKGEVTACNGGNGGSGGAGGNGGAIYNSNYLLLTESTVTSNLSGNGGNGGNGGKGSNRFSYWFFGTIWVNSGNGGNGGNGGNSGSGAGIYHSGTHLEVISNNLTNNTIGTPGNGGNAGSKGDGTGGTNGNPGTGGNSGIGGAVYLTTAVISPQNINFNRILNNTTPDIASNGVNVNAENNWWGTNFESSSPSLAGRVSSEVDADPWIILRLILPTHIYNGIPVQIIGDLTQNSAGNPVGGYIPNGVEANFTATRGSIEPIQHTLNGQATTNYSPTSSGLATFTVKVDNQTVTVNQNVEPRAVLDFTKSVTDSTPNYGDLIHFIITVQNNGPDVTDVNVSDLLPAGLVYQSHTLNAGDYNPTTGLWSISGLSTTGGVYLDIIALVNATGFFNNTATLTQSVYPQDAVNRSATLNVDPAAIISVTKTDDTANHQADVGDKVTFTITVHNAGPDNATNVIITDTLPMGLDFVSASDGGTYNTLTRTITWIAFNLNYGAPDVVRTFVATANAVMAGNTTGIINIANVTYTEYPFTANGTDTAIYVPLADLYIHSWASNNNPYVGDTITLTFKVGNNGPDTARNVVFTLPIPTGMEFVDVTVDQGTATYDPVTRTITWILGDVGMVDPTALVKVKVLSAGNFVFAPSLTTDTYDPNLVSNIQTVTINAQKVPEEVVSGQTVGMQTTGAPIAQLLLAVLMVLSGFLLPKRE